MQKSPLIKVKRLHPEAKLPYYDHPGDAGLALHSVEGKVLAPGERYSFDTGVGMEFPEGFVGLIMDRSGLASKHGIKTMGGVGDAGYRGSYHVIMVNLSGESYEVQKGDKIAQMLIMPVARVTVEEVTELSDTSRGAAGFGSTGR